MLVDPAKLASELKEVSEELGVRIFEETAATGIEKDGVGVCARRSEQSGRPKRSSEPMRTAHC